MDVSELKSDMDRQFAGVAEQFKEVDRQFEQVHQRFEQVDGRFEELMAMIRSEAERTRRHFDVVAEQLTSERNLAIDKSTAVDQRVGRLTATNAADHLEFTNRLTDHEERITELERKRKP